MAAFLLLSHFLGGVLQVRGESEKLQVLLGERGLRGGPLGVAVNLVLLHLLHLALEQNPVEGFLSHEVFFVVGQLVVRVLRVKYRVPDSGQEFVRDLLQAEAHRQLRVGLVAQHAQDFDLRLGGLALLLKHLHQLLEGGQGREERGLFLRNWRVKTRSFNQGHLVIRLQRYVFTVLLQAVMFVREPRSRLRMRGDVPGFFLVAAWRGPLFDRGVEALLGLAPRGPRV